MNENTATTLSATPATAVFTRCFPAAGGGSGLDLSRMQAVAVEVGAMESTPEAERFETLASLPDPTPERDNPAALFEGGYLRKGHGAALIAPAGNGKSSFTVQASILWAMGLPAFGLKPVRPLNIAIIQAEDDAEEMAYFRNDICKGLADDGHPAEDVRAALSKVLALEFVGAAGQDFCDRLKMLLGDRPEIDLVIANPLQSYAGCDISRNAELTQFLRGGIDPVIKPSRAGLLWVHHTNKPPSAKERGGWGTDAFAAYAGAGGAELANWVRAQLSLSPSEHLPGVFTLTAGKRGGRLGWRDSEGNPTNKRYIAHTDGLIYWRDATEAEAGELEGHAASRAPGGRRGRVLPLPDMAKKAGELMQPGEERQVDSFRRLVQEAFSIGQHKARDVVGLLAEQDNFYTERTKGFPSKQIIRRLS